MAEPLLKAGFEKVEWDGKMDSLQRGDILVNTEQHTEIYAGDGKDYGAHEDLDGADGDSSGDEVSLGSYWNDAWDTVLRPTGGAGVTIPEQYGNGGYSVTFYTPRGCYVNGRDTAWAAGTSQAAVHSKWSLAGAKYDDDIATYNGRYLIACTTTRDATSGGTRTARTSSSSRWRGRASTGAATPAARAGRPNGAASASARPSTAAASSSPSNERKGKRT